jgi:hypothetical protein
MSVRRLRLVSILCAAALLVSARPVAAQTFGSCEKQEGVAVSDQYCQPDPGPGGPDVAPEPPIKTALPTSVVKELKAEGAAGKALLELARVAPRRVVRAQTGGRMKNVVDAEGLLAAGALGTPLKPETAAKILSRTATLGEGFAKTFRWALLVTTLVLVGASWLRYRGRSEFP